MAVTIAELPLIRRLGPQRLIPVRPFASLRVGLALLLILAIAPAASFVVYETRVRYEDGTRAAQERAVSAAAVAGAGETARLDALGQGLAAFGQASNLLEASPASCATTLASFASAQPQYAGVALVEASGTVRCSSEPGPAAIDFATRPYFEQAVSSGDVSMGRVTTGRLTGELVLPVAVPVRGDDGQTQALLVAGVDLDWLQENLRSVPLRGDITLALVDGDGVMAASSLDAPSGDPAVVAPAGTGTLGLATDTDGKRRYFAASGVGADAWELRVLAGVSPAATAAEARRDALLHGGAFLLTALAAIAAVSVCINRAVVAPVNRLVKTVRQFGAGDFSVRAMTNAGISEVDELARAFNDAAATVEVLQRVGEQRAPAEPVRNGLLLIDERGTIRRIDPATERLFGYEPGELAGQRFWVLIADESRQAVAGLWRESNPPGRRMIRASAGHGIRGRRKDGSTFSHETTTLLMRPDHDGGYAIRFQFLPTAELRGI